MTRIVTIILFLGLTAFMSAPVQKAELESAISKGDTKALMKMMAPSVSIKVPDHEGNYSKTQAGQILKSFFKRYAPESFSIKRSGNTSDGSVFHIGEYKSSGKEFSVYILLQGESGKEKIKQLKFE